MLSSQGPLSINHCQASQSGASAALARYWHTWHNGQGLHVDGRLGEDLRRIWQGKPACDDVDNQLISPDQVAHYPHAADVLALIRGALGTRADVHHPPW